MCTSKIQPLSLVLQPVYWAALWPRLGPTDRERSRAGPAETPPGAQPEREAAPDLDSQVQARIFRGVGLRAPTPRRERPPGATPRSASPPPATATGGVAIPRLRSAPVRTRSSTTSQRSSPARTTVRVWVIPSDRYPYLSAATSSNAPPAERHRPKTRPWSQ